MTAAPRESEEASGISAFCASLQRSERLRRRGALRCVVVDGTLCCGSSGRGDGREDQRRQPVRRVSDGAYFVARPL